MLGLKIRGEMIALRVLRFTYHILPLAVLALWKDSVPEFAAVTTAILILNWRYCYNRNPDTEEFKKGLLITLAWFPFTLGYAYYML
jgi:hypothetical protein